MLAKMRHQAHHAQDRIVAGLRVAAMGGTARRGDAQPEDAALLGDEVVFRRAADQHEIGHERARFAQESHAVRAEPLLVAGEGEDDLALLRPAPAHDLLAEPDVERGRAFAIIGAEAMDRAVA